MIREAYFVLRITYFGSVSPAEASISFNRLMTRQGDYRAFGDGFQANMGNGKKVYSCQWTV